MKHYISLIIFALSLLTISCNTKETPVNELNDFTENLRENSEEYTDEDWKEAETQYAQIKSELDAHRSEYTDEELNEIGEKEGECLALFTKHAAKDFKEDLKDAMHEATGVAEGFVKGMKE